MKKTKQLKNNPLMQDFSDSDSDGDAQKGDESDHSEE